MTVAADIFVEFDMHQPVFLKTVHLARLAFARFKKAQGFRDWHLIDEDLALRQWFFRNAVAGLDDACICSFGRSLNACGALKERAEGLL